MDKKRCNWAESNDVERDYHDKIWARPVHDDRELFKRLILEGKQAGLSWKTILLKMDTLCDAFDDFAPEKLIDYDKSKIEELLENKGIIRNKLKVSAAVNNAKMYFKLCEKYGSLDKFLWDYVDYTPIINTWEKIEDIPSSTDLSDRISKQLKKEGFKFVGSTTIYALMQSIGMVDDHLLSCEFRSI